MEEDEEEFPDYDELWGKKEKGEDDDYDSDDEDEYDYESD